MSTETERISKFAETAIAAIEATTPEEKENIAETKKQELRTLFMELAKNKTFEERKIIGVAYGDAMDKIEAANGREAREAAMLHDQMTKFTPEERRKQVRHLYKIGAYGKDEYLIEMGRNEG